MKVGVISDTHGLMRSSALTALAGVDHILHAGDVGSMEVLTALREIATVTAVRGNMDHNGFAASLVHREVVELSDALFYLLHDPSHLDLDPAAAGMAAVITGHTHRPHLFREDGVLHLNPGSAGPIRHGLPPSVARIRIDAAGLAAEIVELN